MNSSFWLKEHKNTLIHFFFLWTKTKVYSSFYGHAVWVVFLFPQKHSETFIPHTHSHNIDTIQMNKLMHSSFSRSVREHLHCSEKSHGRILNHAGEEETHAHTLYHYTTAWEKLSERHCWDGLTREKHGMQGIFQRYNLKMRSPSSSLNP